jgi:hypothetical protein
MYSNFRKVREGSKSEALLDVSISNFSRDKAQNGAAVPCHLKIEFVVTTGDLQKAFQVCCLPTIYRVALGIFYHKSIFSSGLTLHSNWHISMRPSSKGMSITCSFYREIYGNSTFNGLKSMCPGSSGKSRPGKSSFQ